MTKTTTRMSPQHFLCLRRQGLWEKNIQLNLWGIETSSKNGSRISKDQEGQSYMAYCKVLLYIMFLIDNLIQGFVSGKETWKNLERWRWINGGRWRWINGVQPKSAPQKCVYPGVRFEGGQVDGCWMAHAGMVQNFADVLFRYCKVEVDHEAEPSEFLSVICISWFLNSCALMMILETFLIIAYKLHNRYITIRTIRIQFVKSAGISGIFMVHV